MSGLLDLDAITTPEEMRAVNVALLAIEVELSERPDRKISVKARRRLHAEHQRLSGMARDYIRAQRRAGKALGISSRSDLNGGSVSLSSLIS